MNLVLGSSSPQLENSNNHCGSIFLEIAWLQKYIPGTALATLNKLF